MITATDLELTAGGRQLLEPVTFQVAPGDRIGLVGRNGAGKTTLARVLAGEALPAAGTVRRSTPVAYLPQDPRTGDLSVIARDRILGARGLDRIVRDMQAARTDMGRRRQRATRAGRSAATRASRSSSTSSVAGRPRPRPARSPPASGFPTGCSPRRSARFRAASGAAWSWPGSCSRAPRR